MKAIDGKLNIGQGYTYIRTEYHGKHKDDLTAVCWQCENCGNGIANIAYVQGDENHKTYAIGLDCAATLTGIEPDKIAQAKKQMRNEAKLYKWIKQEMTFWVETDHSIELFGSDATPREVGRHTPRYTWRVTKKYSKELNLDVSKERELVQVGIETSKYSDYEFKTYKITLKQAPAMVDTGDGVPQYTFAPTGQLSLL